MTPRERKNFITEFQARRSSRITHLSSGWEDQFGSDPATAVDLPDDYDPNSDSGGYKNTEGNPRAKNPEGEAIPSSVVKTNSGSEPVKAKVNVNGVTSEPMVIAGDNRNIDPSNVHTIDISSLEKLENGSALKQLVLRLARNNPNYIKLVSTQADKKVLDVVVKKQEIFVTDTLQLSK